MLATLKRCSTYANANLMKVDIYLCQLDKNQYVNVNTAKIYVDIPKPVTYGKLIYYLQTGVKCFLYTRST